MSYGALEHVAEGVAVQATSNDNAQTNVGLHLIGMIQTSLDLQNNWMKKLNADAQAVFIAAIDPEHPETVSIKIAEKNIDTNRSDVDSNKVNTMVEGEKSKAQELGNNLEQVFNLQESVTEEMGQVTGILNNRF